MHRIDTSTAVDSLPAPGAAGDPGFWRGGNPGLGQQATQGDADFFNMLQEELRAIVVAAGLTPTKGTNTQVRDAIQLLIQAEAGKYAVDSGSANAYVGTYTPAVSSHVAGISYRLKIANTNTGASTFTPGPSVKNIKHPDGSALEAGDLPAGAIATLTYNGTAYQLDELVDPVAQVGLAGFRSLFITNNASTPNTKIDISAADLIAADGNGKVVRSGSKNLTINAATTGTDALDTGTLANNTWYYIFAISNGSAWASLLSTSSSSPTLPAGYTYKVRLGAFRTDGSANFMRILQVGNRAQYLVTGSTNTANLPIVASGAQGNPGTGPTLVSTSIAAVVPPTASEIKVVAQPNGATDANVVVAPNGNYGIATSLTNPPPIQASHASGNLVQNTVPGTMVLESSNIFVAIGGTGGAVAVLGWNDNL